MAKEQKDVPVTVPEGYTFRSYGPADLPDRYGYGNLPSGNAEPTLSEARVYKCYAAGKTTLGRCGHHD